MKGKFPYNLLAADVTESFHKVDPVCHGLFLIVFMNHEKCLILIEKGPIVSIIVTVGWLD